jgi:pilus assembly protein CpaF
VAQASLPADVDGAALRDAARRELLDLGPLEALLEDDNITRIRVALRDVSILRRGQPATHDGTFGSPSGLLRAIRRLCADAGLPITDGEVVVERELSGGRRLSALLPPAAVDGPVLLVQRSRTASTTLNALVRSGTISRGMATLLAHCMTARANMLIVGPPGQGVEEVSSAFGAAAGRGSQLLTIGDDDFGGRAIRLTLRGDELEQASVVVAAARLAPDHLVVRPLSGKPLAALLDAIADGLAGVVLQNPSPTLRQAVDRLAVDVAAARDIGLSAAREWVSRAFDLGIEVSRLKDGRLRVVRIAELRSGSQSGQRDIFTFNYHRTAAGGAIEGSFFASGTVPGVVEDLAARGMPLDTTIFRRHPSG